MVEPNAGIIDPVFAIWRLAVAVAELAGLEFGSRVRRAHVERHSLRERESARAPTCNLADVFMNDDDDDGCVRA